MQNFILQPDTVHTYTGGVDATSIDGNFTTGAYCHSGGNPTSLDISSSHRFGSPKSILQLQFRMWMHGVSTANYDHTLQLYQDIEYQVQGDSNWYQVSGTYLNYVNGWNHDPGQDITIDSGNVVLAVNLQNVAAIRAHVWESNNGNNSPGGELNGVIYEIQAYGNLGGYGTII